MKTLVEIDKNVYGGYGLGYYNDKAIFVTDAIKGDLLEVEITITKKNHYFGKINKIIKASDLRIEPTCENFNECGGCSYLNMEYNNEIEIKKSIILDQLRRIGKLAKNEIPEIKAISDKRFNYRSHANIKCKNGEFGFFKRETNDFIKFKKEGCALLHPKINELLSNDEFKNKIPQLEELKIALDSKENIITSNDSNKTISEKIKNLTYNRDLFNFFQVNRFLRDSMIEEVLNHVKSSKKKSFIDIGSGVGFFTLQLAKFFKSGVGFEIDKESVSWAKKNSKLNSISNIKFLSKPSSQIHPQRDFAEIIIVDPPRAGLDKKTRKTINSILPEQIIYISCNPSTFARDLSDFIKTGYKLNSLTFIDMFPGTYHIEIISNLIKI